MTVLKITATYHGSKGYLGSLGCCLWLWSGDDWLRTRGISHTWCLGWKEIAGRRNIQVPWASFSNLYVGCLWGLSRMLASAYQISYMQAQGSKDGCFQGEKETERASLWKLLSSLWPSLGSCQVLNIIFIRTESLNPVYIQGEDNYIYGYVLKLPQSGILNISDPSLIKVKPSILNNPYWEI